jgi:hypothetical protein
MGQISRYANVAAFNPSIREHRLTVLLPGQAQETGKVEDRQPTPENFTMMQGTQSQSPIPPLQKQSKHQENKMLTSNPEQVSSGMSLMTTNIGNVFSESFPT